jgi:hypothetical protein
MKLKKLTALLLTVAVTTAFMCISADARAYSSYYSTVSFKTGDWESFEDEVVINISSTYDEPTAGDVGVLTEKTSVGLSSSFKKSTSRICKIMLAEQDGFLDFDDIVTYYYAYFYIEANGNYRPENFTRDDSLAEDELDVPNNLIREIESSTGLELYIKVYVSTISGDTSNNIPANLFRYKVWAD